MADKVLQFPGITKQPDDPSLLEEALKIADGELDIEPSFVHLLALRKALKNANDLIEDLKSDGCPICGCFEQQTGEVYSHDSDCFYVIKRCAHCKFVLDPIEQARKSNNEHRR